MREAISGTLMGLGGGLMLFSIGFFLFTLFAIRNPYVGIITFLVLPLLFIAGTLVLCLGIMAGERKIGRDN